MPARALTVVAALIALALVPSSALAAPKKAQIKFSAVTYSVAENAGTFNLVVQRSGNTRNTASANVAITGGTAVGGGVNYTYSGPGSVTFAPGETTKTIPVTIVDNTTADAPNKTIVFRLSGASPSGTQLKNNPATVTIIDNEGPGTLDFSSPSYTVLESGGFATVTVNRLGASNIKLSVHYAASTAVGDPSPATPVTDFTAVTGTLTFNPGEMSKTFQVPITDDSNAESPETVSLALSSPQNLSGGSAPQIGPNSPASLTINDDDTSTFAFQSSLFSVGEGDGQATITVTRSGATNVPASVNYATSNGTATTPGDYTATSGTLNFAAGETSKTFNVPVIDDSADEPNETVNLTLTSGGSTVATSTLDIVDNDNPTESVQFSDTSYSVGEGDGIAHVTLTLSHALPSDVSVKFTSADGTATDGSDYTAASNQVVTFIAGQTTKVVDVPILEDTASPEVEDPETVLLSLSGPSGTNLVLGAPAAATLTINDNDSNGNLEFDALGYSATETGGQATVTVHRVGGSVGTVTVDYATSDGSATAGQDYTAASGTLTFGDGETTKSFVVPIAWDGVGSEPNETINVALSNPGGGSDLATNTAAVIHISDDGASGPVEFDAPSYSVNEAAGTVTVTVTRSGGSLGGPVSADYATSDGSAVAGSDYTPTSGTLTYGPGETSKSFVVPITDDSTHEGAESFGVTLSNPSGGTTLGAAKAATVNIADDDAAPADPSGGGAGGSTPGGSTGTPSTGGQTSSQPTGDPGGAAPTQPAATDKRAPKLTLSAKKIQKAIKAKLLVLSAKCDEKCTVSVVAKIGKGKKAITLGKRSAKASANKKVTIKVKLSKKAIAALTKALKHGKVKVTLSVVAADAARNASKASRAVTAKM
jgi:hypothetical protein